MKLNKGKLYFSILIAGVILIFAVMQVVVFSTLFNAARDNEANSWQDQVAQTANQVGYYMSIGESAVNFTSLKVSNMLQDDVESDDVIDYLVEQSDIFTNAVNGNITGIYGYYRDTYVDGVGWVPAKNYKPTERPWYTYAKAAQGDTVMVPPYVDAQTGSVVTTWTKLLTDGQSVISMDISLNEVQAMIEDLAVNASGSTAMILDKSGFVIADSEADNTGRNYLKDEDTDPILHEVAEKVTSKPGHRFDVSNGTQYMVYSEKINSSWTLVMMLNEDAIFSSLRYVYLLTGLALLVATLIVVGLVIYLMRRRNMVERLQHLSETDKLTGINNRNGGEGRIREMLYRGDKGMLMLMDLDHFKEVNDTYGHDIGDLVLIAVADCLTKVSRTDDVVMRLGGDEFLAYLPGCVTEEGGQNFADRLAEQLSQISIPELEGHEICASMGAAFYNNEERTFEALYKKADVCVYASKKTAGNKITFSQD